MPPLTRGPLPARVYWVRRLMVLGTAALLVFGIARLLGGGSDATSGEDRAAQVAADASSTTSPAGATTGPATPVRTPRKHGGRKTNQPDPTPTLAAPEGECRGEDIAVTPKVTNAVAGRPVMVVLQLRTLESEACTWRTGKDALAVKITSGKDEIWSSRQCPRSIPVRDVVVRKAVTTNVGVTWSARRSDDQCSRFTSWALPGWYHVTAAAVGGEPSDVQFQLRTPTAATITRTASPTQSPKPSQQPTQKPTPKPTQKPSQQQSGRPVTHG